MLPVVVTMSFPVGNATTIAQVQGSTSGAFQLNGTLGTSAGGDLGLYQQRVTITSGGNDSSIFFRIAGLNLANNPITEVLAGGNATVVQSNLDFGVVRSIIPQANLTGGLATTAGTVSAGTNGVGSSLWNIVNWHVSPSNIEVSGVVVGTTAVNYTVQYTYDDPNNLPSGVQYPQPFNHPTLVGATTSLDGSINDPVTAVRLLINSGTGTIRYTMIQAGIGGP